MNNLDVLLSTRKYPDSYTDEVIDNANLLSVSEKGAMPFGSYIYKIQKYPSDIDFTETFEHNGSIIDIAKQFKDRFLKVVNNIIRTKFHYILEAKIGEDPRYDFGSKIIGYIEKGIYYISEKMKIDLVNLSTKLYDNLLISGDDYDKIILIMQKKYLDSYDYDIVYNTFREYKVLRWSVDEILRGYKELLGNIRINIVDAILNGGHVKIDMLTPINGKFTELTNFFYLIKKEPNGKDYYINIKKSMEKTEFLKRSELELPIEVERLFFSKYYYNPFKGLKRLWALARHYRDVLMLEKLTPIVTGNISLLYQLKSEIDTIITILKTFMYLPKVLINNQIQYVKSKMVHVLELNKYDDTFSKMLNKATNENERYAKIETLSIIKDYMIDAINILSLREINKRGLTIIKYPYIRKIPAYDTRYILPANTKNMKLKIDEDKISQSINTGNGCLTCGKNKLQVGGNCWINFLTSDKMKKDYIDYLADNDCENLGKSKYKNEVIDLRNKKNLSLETNKSIKKSQSKTSIQDKIMYKNTKEIENKENLKDRLMDKVNDEDTKDIYHVDSDDLDIDSADFDRFEDDYEFRDDYESDLDSLDSDLDLYRSDEDTNEDNIYETVDDFDNYDYENDLDSSGHIEYSDYEDYKDLNDPNYLDAMWEKHVASDKYYDRLRTIQEGTGMRQIIDDHEIIDLLNNHGQYTQNIPRSVIVNGGASKWIDFLKSNEIKEVYNKYKDGKQLSNDKYNDCESLMKLFINNNNNVTNKLLDMVDDKKGKKKELTGFINRKDEKILDKLPDILSKQPIETILSVKESLDKNPSSTVDSLKEIVKDSIINEIPSNIPLPPPPPPPSFEETIPKNKPYREKTEIVKKPIEQEKKIGPPSLQDVQNMLAKLKKTPAIKDKPVYQNDQPSIIHEGKKPQPIIKEETGNGRFNNRPDKHRQLMINRLSS